MALVMDNITLQTMDTVDENGKWWFIHATGVTKAFQTKGGLYTAMDIAVAYLAGLSNLNNLPLVQWTRIRSGEYRAQMERDAK